MPKAWFIERIGKRIYRAATTCKCKTCKTVTEEGLIVIDEFHAKCLEMYGIKYFDKPIPQSTNEK